MRATVALSVFLLLGLGLGLPAQAQKLTRGTLSGTLLSDTVRVGPGVTGNLFVNVPGFGPGISFVVTQTCVTSTCMVVQGEDFGILPIEGSGVQCQTYDPGVNVGPDSLRCENQCASSQTCLVTGVLTK